MIVSDRDTHGVAACSGATKRALRQRLSTVAVLLVWAGSAMAAELRAPGEIRPVREQQERLDDPVDKVAPEFSPERGIPMGLQCKTRIAVFPMRNAKFVGGGCTSHGYSGVVIR